MVNTVRSQMTLNGSSRSSRQNAVDRVLWRVLLLNLLVAGAKIVVGMLTGTISMIADGFHSVTDASSNVIGLIGSRLASQPPDQDHPYGHQKFETFATLGIGLLLLFTSWNVLKSVIVRLHEGTTPEVTFLSFTVMGVTILINLLVTRYEKRQGRRLNSAILQADADHTRSDIFVSLSVLGSLLAVNAGWPWLDAVVALLIVGVIGYTGLKIVRRASSSLIDRAVVDPNQVEEIALSVDGIRSCHKIRSRGADGMVYVDLHVQVDNGMTIEQAHWLGHLAQRQLKKELAVTDVIVHVEPLKILKSASQTR